MTEQEIKALIEEAIKTAEKSASYYVGKAELFKGLLASIEDGQAVHSKPRKYKKRGKTLNSSPKLREELARDVSTIMRKQHVNKQDAVALWAEQNGARIKTTTLTTYLSPSVLGRKTYNKYFLGLVKRGGSAPKAVNS